jgi:WD40 repeat protein
VLTFDAWAAGRVAPAVVEVPVVAPNAAPKLEAVSKRLDGELTHPGTKETLLGVRFSPDGRRLAAGDYPGGAVSVWDIASGRVLTTIQTGRGDVYTGLFELSPDWQTLYATWGKRDYLPVEQDGKKLTR